MKVVLFCGGYGLRLRDHESRIPKPVVPLGGDPLILHVMRYYAHYGHNEFVLCLGYKGDVVRAQLEMATKRRPAREESRPYDPRQDVRDWDIRYVDTGLDSTIAERLVKVRSFVKDEGTFFANYSDSLSDAVLPELVEQHRASGSVASFMCVRPHLSLHHVELDEFSGRVRSIQGIRQALRINGGFFTLDQEIFDFIEPGDELVEEPFARLIERGSLHGHVYDGFWSTIDTYKDHLRMDTLLKSGNAPWQVWRDLAPAGSADESLAVH